MDLNTFDRRKKEKLILLSHLYLSVLKDKNNTLSWKYFKGRFI